MKVNPPEGNSRRVQYIDGNIRFLITNKAGKKVQCESYQERKLALLKERDPNVLNYMSQPSPIHYIGLDGRSKQYTPDFRATLATGFDEIWEVTLSQRRKEKLSLQEREYMAGIVYPSMKLIYLIFTEEVLPNDTETANLIDSVNHGIG